MMSKMIARLLLQQMAQQVRKLEERLAKSRKQPVQHCRRLLLSPYHNRRRREPP